jgi:hypothetical protein
LPGDKRGIIGGQKQNCTGHVCRFSEPLDRQDFEEPPLSSVANYRFHYRGEVKTGGNGAYVYDITPKKTGPGLIKGQIWMDRVSGAKVVVNGRLTGSPSAKGVVDLVRETMPQGHNLTSRG